MIINGLRWWVRLVSPAHPLLLTPWSTHALGVCDKLTQTIYIDETLSSQQIKEVLYHELVHAFIFSYNVYLSYYEEELVATLMAKYGEDIFQMTNIIYNGIHIK